MNYLRRYLPAVVLLIILSLYPAGAEAPDKSISSVELYEPPTFITIQGNTLVGTISPVVEVKEENALLDEIIHRESRGDPKACNLEFGCGSGMGLVGFIPKTWNSILDRMTCSGIYIDHGCVLSYLPDQCNQKIILPVSSDRIEAIFDPACNRLVGDWLLKKDGIVHWEKFSGPYDLTLYQ